MTLLTVKKSQSLAASHFTGAADINPPKPAAS